ncbi:MAG: hypothetical protein IJG53_07800, partial [Eggerthellaceae bacterium]|nr:hypothetical protein [Eggerthellaceae bacterium]
TVILALIVAIKWKLEKSKRIGASLVRVAVAGIGWGLILFLFFLNVQLLLYGVVTADQLTAAAQAAAASPDAGGAVFGWILKAIAVIAGFISKFISAAWVCEMLAIVVIQFVLIAIVCIICYFIDDTSSYFLPLFLGICVFVVFIVGINTGSTSGLMKVMSVLVS